MKSGCVWVDKFLDICSSIMTIKLIANKKYLTTKKPQQSNINFSETEPFSMGNFLKTSTAVKVTTGGKNEEERAKETTRNKRIFQFSFRLYQL